MSMSLFAVLSPRTVEPKRPNWQTPTVSSWPFNDCKRLRTELFFIAFLICGQSYRLFLKFPNFLPETLLVFQCFSIAQASYLLGINIISGTTIGFVFSSIVPQLRPRPKEEPRMVVGSFLNLSAMRVTISEGMLAPPRLPNSSRL